MISFIGVFHAWHQEGLDILQDNPDTPASPVARKPARPRLFGSLFQDALGSKPRFGNETTHILLNNIGERVNPSGRLTDANRRARGEALAKHRFPVTARRDLWYKDSATTRHPHFRSLSCAVLFVH